MTSASASRVTRSSRSLRRAALLFACGLAAAGLLRAQEPKAPEGTTGNTEATGRPEAAAPEQPTAAEPAKAGGKSAPASAAGSDDADRTPPPKGPSPSRFEPTEKVRADFDVSFPVDI